MTNALVQLAAAFIGSAGFSLLFNTRGPLLLWGSLGGLLSWGVYLAFGLLYLSDPAQYFVAAFILTVYAEIMARIHKSPVTVFLVAGTIPLIPGGSLYHTMRYVVTGAFDAALHAGIVTLVLAGAIAAGILACMMFWNLELKIWNTVRKNTV